jgi:hypothetical protein
MKRRIKMEKKRSLKLEAMVSIGLAMYVAGQVMTQYVHAGESNHGQQVQLDLEDTSRAVESLASIHIVQNMHTTEM